MSFFFKYLVSTYLHQDHLKTVLIGKLTKLIGLEKNYKIRQFKIRNFITFNEYMPYQVRSIILKISELDTT